jgi:signal transduction histidine kinase/CheY-like chemotaxis protein
MPLGPEPETDASSAGYTPNDWRDRMSVRFARLLALFYAIIAVALTMTMRGYRARVALVVTALCCVVPVAIPALTGRPKGRAGAWLVVIPGILASLVGYATVGFLSGPAVVLAIVAMVSGLLLGKRAMIAISLATGAVLFLIAWAMIHSILPVPIAADVSMTQAMPWVRTTFLVYLSIFLLGTMLIEIVSRMERSVERANKEVLLREQAERAKAEAEIMALETKQLETIGRLAAGVAHDFNNNLTAIIGCAELLKAEVSSNAEANELADGILKSSHRAAELTHQLLAYSRKAKMVLAGVDVHQSITNAVTLLRRSIDPRVQIVVDLGAEHSVVLADSALLNNALLNVLVNAGDAMPEGGQLTIATTTYMIDAAAAERGLGLAAGCYVMIEVIDTGHGIDPEILPHIFDPFFTTKPVGKGTGLGLAAVYGTVKGHRGSIEVTSELGSGTAFRILLPCDNHQASSSRPESEQLVRGSGEVLLIDDDLLVRSAAASTLRDLGYRVTLATDGVHALQILGSSPQGFDLAILDLRMPKMNGEATYEEMRRVSPNLPVLIWSGFGTEREVTSVLRKGAAGFIQKPYRIAEFSRVIHEVLESAAERT